MRAGVDAGDRGGLGRVHVFLAYHAGDLGTLEDRPHLVLRAAEGHREHVGTQLSHQLPQFLRRHLVDAADPVDDEEYVTQSGTVGDAGADLLLQESGVGEAQGSIESERGDMAAAGETVTVGRAQ